MPTSSGYADYIAARGRIATRFLSTAQGFSKYRLRPTSNRVGAFFYAPGPDGLPPSSPRKRLALSLADYAAANPLAGKLEAALLAVEEALQDAERAAALGGSATNEAASERGPGEAVR